MTGITVSRSGPPCSGVKVPVLLLAALIVSCSISGLIGQSTGTGAPQRVQEPQVLQFEPLPYPLRARVRSIEGIVVLRASTDAHGEVNKVVTLSGSPDLSEEAVKNLRTWRFSEPRNGDLIVVYWFRKSGLCEAPCASGFEFHPPNLAIVTIGHELAMQ